MSRQMKKSLKESSWFGEPKCKHLRLLISLFFFFFCFFFSNFVRMEDILWIRGYCWEHITSHFWPILEWTWLVLWILRGVRVNSQVHQVIILPIGRAVFFILSWPYDNSTLYHNQSFLVDDLWPFLLFGCFFPTMTIIPSNLVSLIPW